VIFCNVLSNINCNCYIFTYAVKDKIFKNKPQPRHAMLHMEEEWENKVNSHYELVFSQHYLRFLTLSMPVQGVYSSHFVGCLLLCHSESSLKDG